MLKFVAVALLLTVFVAVGEQCCTPAQWESFVGIEETKAVAGKIQVTGSYAIESYDFDRKKIALTYPETGSRQVQDYGKGLLYMITGGQCYTNPWPYSMPRCIPDNATAIATFEMGGPDGLMVEQYDLSTFLPGFNGYMQFSIPGCLPVSQTQYYDSYVTMFGFTNITEGIRDPSVFDIPSPPCSRDMDNAVEPLLFGTVQP